MSRDQDAIRSFRQEYLDYVEGLRATPPRLDALSDSDRGTAERWVTSLHAARGIDPYASRPSVADLLSRAEAFDQSLSEEKLERIFRASLQRNVDARALVMPDLASLEAGLRSRLVVQARGMRVRVLIEPTGTDIDSAYSHRVADVAAVFGAFPDTSGVLLMTAGPEPMGAVVDRDDVVPAIETPSGQRRPPRIRRPISDPILACQQFFVEAIPLFEPFDYHAVSHTAPTTELVDTDRIAAIAVAQIAAAGQRARLEAKRITWSGLGATETRELSGLLKKAMQSPLDEANYRRRLAELVDAA